MPRIDGIFFGQGLGVPPPDSEDVEDVLRSESLTPSITIPFLNLIPRHIKSWNQKTWNILIASDGLWHCWQNATCFNLFQDSQSHGVIHRGMVSFLDIACSLLHRNVLEQSRRCPEVNQKQRRYQYIPMFIGFDMETTSLQILRHCLTGDTKV